MSNGATGTLLFSNKSTIVAAGDVHGRAGKVFTVWRKSLVLNGHGCTVYDSDGGIVYRVDNHGSARCGGGGGGGLMDLHGTVILNIVKRKLTFGRWEGYRRWPGQTPWFTVTRPCSPFRRRPPSSLGASGGTLSRTSAAPGSRGCRIVDFSTGLTVAEAMRKTTACGVALGEDSLVMGLVLVHGLYHAM